MKSGTFPKRSMQWRQASGVPPLRSGQTGSNSARHPAGVRQPADAVAVIDLDGKVEVATEAARSIFGLKPNTLVSDLPFGWMAGLCNGALTESRIMQQKNNQKIVQQFVNGEERYYRPEAIPILDNDRQPTGVVLVLQDVTQLRQQDEIKRGVISTVSIN